MLQVKLPVVDRTHPQGNNFGMGVESKATGDSKFRQPCLDTNKVLLAQHISILDLLW